MVGQCSRLMVQLTHELYRNLFPCRDLSLMQLLWGVGVCAVTVTTHLAWAPAIPAALKRSGAVSTWTRYETTVNGGGVAGRSGPLAAGTNTSPRSPRYHGRSLTALSSRLTIKTHCSRYVQIIPSHTFTSGNQLTSYNSYLTTHSSDATALHQRHLHSHPCSLEIRALLTAHSSQLGARATYPLHPRTTTDRLTVHGSKEARGSASGGSGTRDTGVWYRARSPYFLSRSSAEMVRSRLSVRQTTELP